jgi:hypothetical protein
MSGGELRVTLPLSLSEDEAKLLLAVKLLDKQQSSQASQSGRLWRCLAGIIFLSLIILLMTCGKRSICERGREMAVGSHMGQHA